MTNNERLDGLLAYLDGLTKLVSGGEYRCHAEIVECVRAIRAELSLGDE